MEDLSFLKELWNDGRVMRWVGFPNGVGYTNESILAWFRRRIAEPRFHHFIVWENDGPACGEVCYGVDAGTSRAGLDVKFVPEKHGKGLATEALSRLIEHVFTTELDVEEVWAEPVEDNGATRRLYTRCGLQSKDRPADMKQGKSY